MENQEGGPNESSKSESELRITQSQKEISPFFQTLRPQMEK